MLKIKEKKDKFYKVWNRVSITNITEKNIINKNKMNFRIKSCMKMKCYHKNNNRGDKIIYGN